MSGYFNPIFEDLLCAFRKKYSSQSTFIKAIDGRNLSLDLRWSGLFPCIYLPRAFDCLPYGLIMSKLHAYGVSVLSFQQLFL